MGGVIYKTFTPGYGIALKWKFGRFNLKFLDSILAGAVQFLRKKTRNACS